MGDPFPDVLWRFGPVVITDTVLLTLLVSLLLVVGGRAALASGRLRGSLEVVYETLEDNISGMASVNVRPLVPLVLTQWLFIAFANLMGVLPGLPSPTRDLSLAAALALISFVAGHIYAFRQKGFAYLRQYIEPNPLLLPFNIIGEISRTVAMALRLFGNMLSGNLVGAIFVYLVGVLLPVPLLLLSVLTSVVQAYIFGVLTLVFAASSVEAAESYAARRADGKESS